MTGASTKPIILAILKRGENYGYEIIRQVKEVSGGEIEWSEPMLYPFLKRLEKDGLVKSRWRLSERGPLRKYYRLTELGRAELEREKAQWRTVHAALTWLFEPAAGEL
ncbi:MAG: helix-turn-helix transcriptional regulator [Candidatus Aminicenantes bacterium]|nr:helix-turn-helix transcriptional regulator [Candidatus Aminicenantes bacterium]